MGTNVPIFALPPDPRYGGHVPARLIKISGAQNLSGCLRFLPGPLGPWLCKNSGPMRFYNCAWLCRANACGPFSP